MHQSPPTPRLLLIVLASALVAAVGGALFLAQLSTSDEGAAPQVDLSQLDVTFRGPGVDEVPSQRAELRNEVELAYAQEEPLGGAGLRTASWNLVILDATTSEPISDATVSWCADAGRGSANTDAAGVAKWNCADTRCVDAEVSIEAAGYCPLTKRVTCGASAVTRLVPFRTMEVWLSGCGAFGVSEVWLRQITERGTCEMSAKYGIEGPASFPNCGLSGAVTAIIRFRDGAAWSSTVNVAPDQTRVDLEIPELIGVSILVVDATDNAPLVGATVQGGEAHGLRGRSDERGRVDVRVSPTEVHLSVASDGYASSSLKIRAALLDENRTIIVPMERALSLYVGVAGDDGKAICGARVQLQRLIAREAIENEGQTHLCAEGNGYSVEPSLRLALPEAVTGASGSAIIHGIPACLRCLRVRATHPAYDSEASIRLSAADCQGLARVELELPTTGRSGRGSISGVVTVGAQPVRGEIFWKSRALSGLIKVAGDGYFYLSDVPAGVLRLFIAPATAHSQNLSALCGYEPHEVTVVADDCRSVRVDLQCDLVCISGELISICGAATSGESITYVSSHANLSCVAFADHVGHFEILVPRDSVGHVLVGGYGAARGRSPEMRGPANIAIVIDD